MTAQDIKNIEREVHNLIVDMECGFRIKGRTEEFRKIFIETLREKLAEIQDSNF